MKYDLKGLTYGEVWKYVVNGPHNVNVQMEQIGIEVDTRTFNILGMMFVPSFDNIFEAERKHIKLDNEALKELTSRIPPNIFGLFDYVTSAK